MLQASQSEDTVKTRIMIKCPQCRERKLNAKKPNIPCGFCKVIEELRDFFCPTTTDPLAETESIERKADPIAVSDYDSSTTPLSVATAVSTAEISLEKPSPHTSASTRRSLAYEFSHSSLAHDDQLQSRQAAPIRPSCRVLRSTHRSAQENRLRLKSPPQANSSSTLVQFVSPTPSNRPSQRKVANRKRQRITLIRLGEGSDSEPRGSRQGVFSHPPVDTVVVNHQPNSEEALQRVTTASTTTPKEMPLIPIWSIEYPAGIVEYRRIEPVFRLITSSRRKSTPPRPLKKKKMPAWMQPDGGRFEGPTTEDRLWRIKASNAENMYRIRTRQFANDSALVTKLSLKMGQIASWARIVPPHVVTSQEARRLGQAEDSASLKVIFGSTGHCGLRTIISKWMDKSYRSSVSWLSKREIWLHLLKTRLRVWSILAL